MNKQAQIKTINGEIYLWFDELFLERRKKGLSKEKIERKAIKDKIQQLFPGAILKHEVNGAPILLNATYSNLSISHYRGGYALYFSNESCGVDIQYFKDTLLKGRDYFVNTEEEELDLNKTNLHLIWSAKEAFFKKQKGNISDLKKEVSIKAIFEDSIQLAYKGQIETVFYRVFQDFVLVWT